MATSAFPSSYVTGVPSPPHLGSSPRDAATCPACPHAADDHDAVSARFCRATAAAGTSRRGCICRS